MKATPGILLISLKNIEQGTRNSEQGKELRTLNYTSKFLVPCSLFFCSIFIMIAGFLKFVIHATLAQLARAAVS